MKIKCAAIFYNGIVYEGNSHAEIGIKMIEDKVCDVPYPSGQNQGFVTECGKYVNRKEAMEIAIKANQVIKNNFNVLYSEFLIKGEN